MNYFRLLISISTLALSIVTISLSSYSISFSKSLIYLFILSMFNSLWRKFSLLSCSCFLRCCFRKQKSQDLSLFIFFLLHSPQIELAHMRLYKLILTNDDDSHLAVGWKVACIYYSFPHWQITLFLLALMLGHSRCLGLNIYKLYLAGCVLVRLSELTFQGYFSPMFLYDRTSTSIKIRHFVYYLIIYFRTKLSILF